MDAGTQVFYSYAICFGCQIALGSYNKYHRNFMKDCITICAFNSGTSLIGGVVIFSVLGYMAHESGLSVEDVAQGGPGLAFVVYPTAVSLMPYAPFWAFAFFFMLVLVGIDSQFVGVEGTEIFNKMLAFDENAFHLKLAGFVVAITDLLSEQVQIKHKYWREYVTLVTCVLSFIAGLTMVTEVRLLSKSILTFKHLLNWFFRVDFTCSHCGITTLQQVWHFFGSVSGKVWVSLGDMVQNTFMNTLKTCLDIKSIHG